jgi:hypothetical protein
VTAAISETGDFRYLDHESWNQSFAYPFAVVPSSNRTVLGEMS